MYLIKTIALIYLLSTPVSALAAASGSSPKGKPFVEINGQIVEVQGQLVTLEQRMDNVILRMAGYETRLGGIEAGIESLEADGQALEQKLLDLESGLTTVEEIVAELEAKDLDLQAELDAYGDTTGQLALDIDANLMLIESLSASLDDGVSGLQLLIAQINEVLADLQSVQDSLVEQIRLKQQILDGTCDEGFEFRGFQDGEHVCQEVPISAGPIEIFKRIALRELAAVNIWQELEGKAYGQYWYARNYSGAFGPNSNRADTLPVACPAGSSIMGGGPLAYPAYFLEVDYSHGVSPDSWKVKFAAINQRRGSGGPAYREWNPLWLPHVRGGGGRLPYGDSSTDPEETLVVSVYVLCARAANDEASLLND